MLRGVAVGLGALLLLAVLGAGGALWATLPPRQQTLRLAGLHHPVSVSIDDKGVPRIVAADLSDAATATGYLHARDRMFQMELTRRVGSGRVSEIAGPAGLPIDRTMRTLGLRRLAEAAYPALPEATRALFDAYARGVNAAIASRGRFIAPEFLLLGRPEPWTPADSLLWGRLMGLSLAGNWRVELDRLALSQRVPLPRLLGLWPDHADTAPPQAARAEPALSRLAARTDRAVPRFPDPFTLPDEASDEWAVDGAHSATGAPLLAGDPHLAFGFPAIWYLLRIDVPGYGLAGATAPGIPFLVIGQNGHVAWTFTSSSADTQDLFVETPLPGGRYATPDGPRPFATRREVIHVRGRPDTVLVVRATRHGPVVSDVLPPADTGGRVLAAAMENLLPEDAAPGLAALNRAGDVDEAGRAAALITTPVQNLLVADCSRIALFTTGRVPVRRSGDGSFPADGASGAGDWIGQAGGGALPTIVAPASGHLLNGNERTAPPGFPVFMGRDWPGAWRADRIRALLDAAPRHDVAGFVRMQTDITSAFAQAMLPLLLARPMHPASSSVAARALALLGGWSGVMAAGRPQPLLVQRLDAALRRRRAGPGRGPGRALRRRGTLGGRGRPVAFARRHHLVQRRLHPRAGAGAGRGQPQTRRRAGAGPVGLALGRGASRSVRERLPAGDPAAASPGPSRGAGAGRRQHLVPRRQRPAGRFRVASRRRLSRGLRPGRPGTEPVRGDAGTIRKLVVAKRVESDAGLGGRLYYDDRTNAPTGRRDAVPRAVRHGNGISAVRRGASMGVRARSGPGDRMRAA